MIKLSKIKKIYNDGTNREKTVLSDINLEVNHGESIAVMGRSGSGKTTLMNIIGMLDFPTSGQYYFMDNECHNLSSSKQAEMRSHKIGILMQDYSLIDHDSALNNVMLPLFFNKTSFREMKIKALQAMEMIGIEKLSGQRVVTLSGGEKQRVALARALVTSPQLLIADEPTGSLDFNTGKQILDIIQELNHKGLTIIIVTHDNIVAQTCKKTLILRDGRLKEKGNDSSSLL